MKEGFPPLYKDGWGSGVETVVRSADGSQYRVGPAKFFHKVIFDMVNSTRLLQLAVELNLLSYKNATKFLSSESAASKRNAVETLSLDSIITLISHLEACSSHHFAVYDLNDNQQPELKYKRAGNQNSDTLILFKQNGMLCQLHVKETADIPGFLKEFVAEQLSTYIDSAFTALLMTEKREYVIRCGDIHPVDYLNSGVIETNKRWGARRPSTDTGDETPASNQPNISDHKLSLSCQVFPTIQSPLWSLRYHWFGLRTCILERHIQTSIL